MVLEFLGTTDFAALFLLVGLMSGDDSTEDGTDESGEDGGWGIVVWDLDSNSFCRLDLWREPHFLCQFLPDRE